MKHDVDTVTTHRAGGANLDNLETNHEGGFLNSRYLPVQKHHQYQAGP